MPIGILLFNERVEVQWTNPLSSKFILGIQKFLGKKINEID